MRAGHALVSLGLTAKEPKREPHRGKRGIQTWAPSITECQNLWVARLFLSSSLPLSCLLCAPPRVAEETNHRGPDGLTGGRAGAHGGLKLRMRVRDKRQTRCVVCYSTSVCIYVSSASLRQKRSALLRFRAACDGHYLQNMQCEFWLVALCDNYRTEVMQRGTVRTERTWEKGEEGGRGGGACSSLLSYFDCPEECHHKITIKWVIT